METPAGIRVAQWLDQTSEDGLIDLKVPMSSDPPLGEWKIVVVRGNDNIEKTFKVDEYGQWPVLFVASFSRFQNCRINFKKMPLVANHVIFQSPSGDFILCMENSISTFKNCIYV